MRMLLLTCLALTTTACAGGDRPPMRHGPGGGPGGGPGQFRHGGPEGGGERGGGMRGRLFVSPVGEPFRTDGGPDPEDVWFAQADTDHDGMLTPAEFAADAMRFFAVLDRGHDGEIDPDDIDYYESELLPEVRVGGGASFSGGKRGGRGGGRRSGGGRHGGGGQPGSEDGESGGGESPAAPRIDDSTLGAARYGFFDYPEPVTPMDTNYNRGISPAEFRAAAEKRFAMLDRNGTGALRLKDLPRVSRPGFDRPPGTAGHRPDRDRPRRDDE